MTISRFCFLRNDLKSSLSLSEDGYSVHKFSYDKADQMSTYKLKLQANPHPKLEIEKCAASDRLRNMKFVLHSQVLRLQKHHNIDKNIQQVFIQVNIYSQRTRYIQP